MTDIHVDLDALASMARHLSQGSEELRSVPDVPARVSAGPVEPLMGMMIAGIVTSTSSLAAAMETMGEAAEDSRRYYSLSDNDSARSLDDIRRELEER